MGVESLYKLENSSTNDRERRLYPCFIGVLIELVALFFIPLGYSLVYLVLSIFGFLLLVYGLEDYALKYELEGLIWDSNKYLKYLLWIYISCLVLTIAYIILYSWDAPGLQVWFYLLIIVPLITISGICRGIAYNKLSSVIEETIPVRARKFFNITSVLYIVLGLTLGTILLFIGLFYLINLRHYINPLYGMITGFITDLL